MLETRLLKGNDNEICKLIAQSREKTDVSEQKALNNLLATFYIKPAAVDQEGSIELVHESFGEFLFAERLKEAIEDWSKPGERRRGTYLVSDEELHWEIYDLLGYGGLTPEIMDYLMVMLEDGQEWRPIVLFERLNQFWESWCDGEFIDAPSENFPQKKMRMLREQMADREKALGLRQVDVHSGLNILILLLSLHRYAHDHDELKSEIDFHLNGESLDGTNIDSRRLWNVIHYADCLKFGNFRSIVGFYLSGADLSGADLSGAYLSNADLSGAYLSNADLTGAYLTGANLTDANLTDADLTGANLAGAYLTGTNLTDANLTGAYLAGAYLTGTDLTGTDLTGAYFTGANLPDRFKQQLNLPSP
jgi:uncharacterized protein YjbI with pentapeptide repeats